MTSEQLRTQMEHVYRQLTREFAEVAAGDEVVSRGRAHFDRLSDEAAITDFIPLLVYRYTKEELTTNADRLRDAA